MLIEYYSSTRREGSSVCGTGGGLRDCSVRSVRTLKSWRPKEECGASRGWQTSLATLNQCLKPIQNETLFNTSNHTVPGSSLPALPAHGSGGTGGGEVSGVVSINEVKEEKRTVAGAS